MLCNKNVHESSHEIPEISICRWFNPHESRLGLSDTVGVTMEATAGHGWLEERCALFFFTMKTCEKKRYKTTSMGILNCYMCIQLYIHRYCIMVCITRNIL